MLLPPPPQIIEKLLSRDNKLQLFKDGSVQITVSGGRELYLIKFTNYNAAKIFHSQVEQEMGQFTAMTVVINFSYKL